MYGVPVILVIPKACSPNSRESVRYVVAGLHSQASGHCAGEQATRHVAPWPERRSKMLRPDEATAIRTALAKGVRITPVPPDSHMVEGVAGRFLFEGLRVTDEGFSHAALGTLNVTKALSLIPKGMTPRKTKIEPALLESASGTELDEELLSTMT